MLAQTERSQEIERHRGDQIVIFRRTDISTILRVARFKAEAKIFSIRVKPFPFSLQRSQRGAVEDFQRVLRFIGKSDHAARPVELIDASRRPLTEWKCPEFIALDCFGCARDSARFHRQSI